MDPLSALSIAASVVQFVDFGLKIVSKTKEIYNSSKGESIDDALTEATAKRLTILAKDLESSLQLEGHQDLPSDKALYNICVSCIILGNQLTARFDKLRIRNDSKHRAWKSFRQALKSVWCKGEIDAISRQLADHRKELDSHILFSLRCVTLFPHRSDRMQYSLIK
jgi:hypothetical protein